MKMHRQYQFPPVLLTRAIGLWLSGRVRWIDPHAEGVADSTEKFAIFRKVMLKPSAGLPDERGALLEVRFHFRRFSLRINKLLSLIPIPFIVAQHGFRSKTWMYEKESGMFQGLYEWDTYENALNYESSLPLRLMKKRAVPGSLVFKIRKADNKQVVPDDISDTT